MKKILFLLAGISWIAAIYLPFGKAITTEVFFTRFELFIVEFFIFVGCLNFILVFFSYKFIKIIHIFFYIFVLIWFIPYIRDIINLKGRLGLGAYSFLVSYISVFFAYCIQHKNKK